MKINVETAKIWNDAIFIVELHHQYVGAVWMAEDEDSFVKICQDRYQHDGEAPHSDDFDEWVEYNGHDLRIQTMLNLDEAIDYIDEGNEGSNKLYQLLIRYDFLEDDDDDE